MSQAIIDEVVQSQLKTDLPRIDIGDTVDVHLRIIEGSKERIQVFSGVVIARRGRGTNESITVRRIVANEGVERIIPLASPRVATIEVKRRAQVRRGKLYFLRERVGKRRRLPDRKRGASQKQKAQKQTAQTQQPEPTSTATSTTTPTPDAGPPIA